MERPLSGRVLAAFERACDLVTDEGQVVGLVLRDLGDGPLNVVLEGRPGAFDPLEPGMLAWIEGSRLRVGEVAVELAQAAVWDPRPDWEALRARRVGIVGRLPGVQALARAHAPAGSLLAAGDEYPVGPSDPGAALHKAAIAAHQVALADLHVGWQGNRTRLRAGAAGLAGLGGGLTPAGDDFLVGFMLGAWLAHPDPGPFCREVTTAAVPRTTTLSAAFLEAASCGECSAAWHRLLAALGGGQEGATAAVLEMLAYGATSGADALAGFLSLSGLAQFKPEGSPSVARA